uniref:Ig-like domain-containing protein n=1 Tax=Hucho hucho TaxID=62062 RepID=A0A4W5QJU3_9TELE
VKTIFFFTVFSVVVKSQLKPQVSMVPTFKLVYSGDTIILSCENSTGQVKWFLNQIIMKDKNQANKKLSIGAVSANNSGSYQCEDNGQKSDSFVITVREYLPPATLSIKSGEPVINIDGSVVLELLVEDNSLMGWCCWVYKGGKVRRIKLKKSLTIDHKELTFQPYKLSDNIAIYWCSDETDLRSTSLTIKTSDRIVRMMILPGPALLGETLSLRCVVSGTKRISHTIIYKEEKAIQDSSSSSYVINNVTESDEGKYSCQATFTRRDGGPQNTVNSTQQELIVSAPPMKAVLSAGMYCSCSSCPDDATYHWYYKLNNHQWITKETRQSFAGVMSAGIYACRAVWKDGRSARSNRINVLLITLGLIFLGVVLVIGAIVMYRKRRAGEGKPTTDILSHCVFLCAHTYMFV